MRFPPRTLGDGGASVCMLILFLGWGCGSHSDDADAMEASRFEDVFRIEYHIELEEKDEDLIGDIGLLREADNGDLLVSDRLKPRIRRYDSTGALISAFGTFGAGPNEWRRIGGFVETPSGQIMTIDPVLGRATLLESDLRRAHTFRLAVLPRGPAEPMNGGVLILAASGSRANSLVLLSQLEWSPSWRFPAPSPGPMNEYPYWGSVAHVPFTTSASEIVVGYSLRYPILIYSRYGTLVDSLPRPRSFREAPRVQAGAFTGPGASERLQRWLASFDVVAELAVVCDSLLVVAHGQLTGGAANRFGVSHVGLDVYHIGSRTVIARNVPLPTGARVVAGGRGLYMLTKQPPSPWTVVRLQVRPTKAR